MKDQPSPNKQMLLSKLRFMYDDMLIYRLREKAMEPWQLAGVMATNYIEHRAEILRERAVTQVMTCFCLGVEFRMLLCPIGEIKVIKDIKKDFMYENKLNKLIASGVSRQAAIDQLSITTAVAVKKPFWLSETEVTQELYLAVMGNNPSKNKDRGLGGARMPKLNHPVENVKWDDVLEFCNKLSVLNGLQPAYIRVPGSNDSYEDGMEAQGNEISNDAYWHLIPDANGYRLPRIAEWQYAASDLMNQTVPIDEWFTNAMIRDNIDDIAWHSGNSRINGEAVTHAVKQKKPNRLGFYDMLGNVSEMCWAETPFRDKELVQSAWYRLGIRTAFNNEPTELFDRIYGQKGQSLDIGFRIARNI